MDYKYRYLRELQELIQSLKESVKIEIYYDLIKLEDWMLPDMNELKEYLNALDFDIDVMLWKFIYKELTFIHHAKVRNERVIRMLKFIKNKKLKIKPFVTTYAPMFPDWKSDEAYFLRAMRIKHYDRRDHYYHLYNKLYTKKLLEF